MPMIVVTPLSRVAECIELHAPSHLVTLLGREFMIETPEGISPHRHLKVEVDDVADASSSTCAPCEAHVRSLIAFGREWNPSAPMLVHCWAGISRSMAAAYAVLCDRMGPGREREIAERMRSLAPHANPNRLLVRLADDLLGRSGRMVDAIEAIGNGELAIEGRPVRFSLAPEKP